MRDDVRAGDISLVHCCSEINTRKCIGVIFFPTMRDGFGGRPTFRGSGMERVDASDSIRFNRVTWVRADSRNDRGWYMMFPKQRYVCLTIAVRLNILKPLSRDVKYYLLLYLRRKVPRKRRSTIPHSYLPLGKIKKIHRITRRPRAKISGHYLRTKA